MSFLRNLRRRLEAVVDPEARHREIDEEFAFHIERKAAELERQGMTAAAAQAAARQSFGQSLQIHEAGYDIRGGGWIEQLADDLRFTTRILARNHRATFIIVAILALTLGANTAVFSLIRSVLLDPLPYADSGRLVVLHQGSPSRTGGVSYPNFLDWRARSHSFTGMAVYSSTYATLTGAGPAARINGAVVSARLFELLGVKPLRGRLFEPGEDLLGVGRPVLISENLWRSRFQSSETALGREIRLDGGTFQIAGVLSHGGEFPIQSEPLDYWITVAVDADPAVYGGAIATSRGYTRYDGAVARLKSGTSLQQAQAEMSVIASAIAATHPHVNSTPQVRVISALRDLVDDTRPLLFLLFGLVTCVLAVGCANAANLLLVRATARRKELAVRSALGARRSRLVRQLLIESLLYSATAGIAGLFLAWMLLRAVVALAPPETPRLDNVHIDALTLVYTMGLSALTGLAFGIYPALAATRLDPQKSLKEGARTFSTGRGSLRSRSALTIAQIALSLVLTCFAALLTTSFLRTLAAPKGFDPRGVLTASLSLPSPQYPRQSPAVLRFYRELSDRVRVMPGVQSVAVAESLPLNGSGNSTNFRIEGQSRREETSAGLRFVDPTYFATLHIALREGRGFTDRDNASAEPCVIVNEAFRRQYLDGRDFRGVRLNLGWGGDAPKRIIGIGGDVRYHALSAEAVPEMYVPLGQWSPNDLSILIRTTGDPSTLARSLEAAVRTLDPSVPVDRIRTLDEYLTLSVSRQRFLMLIVAAFSLCTLLLAAVGLYGVMSYSAACRRQEFGIRLALGATAPEVVRLVLRQGVTLGIAGVALGLALAAASARAVASWIYAVDPLDPVIYTATGALLVAVAVGACWGPARRAGRVDPAVSLRTD